MPWTHRLIGSAGRASHATAERGVATFGRRWQQRAHVFKMPVATLFGKASTHGSHCRGVYVYQRKDTCRFSLVTVTAIDGETSLMQDILVQLTISDKRVVSRQALI